MRRGRSRGAAGMLDLGHIEGVLEEARSTAKDAGGLTPSQAGSFKLRLDAAAGQDLAAARLPLGCDEAHRLAVDEVRASLPGLEEKHRSALDALRAWEARNPKGVGRREP